MKIKIFIIFLLLLMINPCGYNPIYYKENNTFKISKLEINGIGKINNKINSSLKNFQNLTKYQREFELNLLTEKETNIASKDAKGDIKTFDLKISVKLIVKEDDVILKTKNFQKNYIYNSINNKFDQSKNEKILMENLTEKIIEEIILFLYSV